MVYVYYCKNCKTLIASKKSDARYRCVKCNSLFLSLEITTDKWMTLSDDQRTVWIDEKLGTVENNSNNAFSNEPLSDSESKRQKAIIKEMHTYVENIIKNGIDVEPPKENDDTVLIPINCWFDKKVYIALYLLRYHKIAGIKMSYHELPQLQVYVKKENLELIRQTCSMTALSGGNAYWPKDYTYIDTFNYLMDNHPIMLLYSRYFKEEYRYCAHDVEDYEVWEKDYRDKIYQDSIAEYGKLKYPSEYRLYFFLRFLFPDAIFQYHAEWLGQQSLDIYIPSAKIGIEYQGLQHYEPVDFFGGDSKLELQHEMDVEKKRKCAKEGVRLFEWPYDRWISETEILKNAIIWYPGDTSWITHEYLMSNMEKMCPHTTIDEFLRSIQLRRLKGHYEKKKVKKQPTIPKKVCRKYDIHGVFIEEYPTSVIAAKACAVSVTSILKVCGGKRKTAAGFQWRLEDADSEKHNIDPVEYSDSVQNPGTGRPVVQIDEDGVVVNRFNSISEASRVVGVDVKSIRAAASGKQKKAAGYYWMFND